MKIIKRLSLLLLVLASSIMLCSCATKTTSKKEVVKYYSGYYSDVTNNINDFLDKNSNYKIKHITSEVTDKTAHGCFIVVVYEYDE